jgi:hypothetical protein
VSRVVWLVELRASDGSWFCARYQKVMGSRREARSCALGLAAHWQCKARVTGYVPRPPKKQARSRAGRTDSEDAMSARDGYDTAKSKRSAIE